MNKPSLRSVAGTALLLFVVMPAVGQAADVSDDAAIVVTAARGQKTTTFAATKTPLRLSEVPQSISVLDKAQLRGEGVASLNQALRTVAGVTPELRGANADVFDQFKLRGFTVPTYLDGLREFISPTGYAAPQVDISRIEEIEIVKGPASVLYGQSSPGGIVALTSKLPVARSFYGDVSGTYGTFDLFRVDGDIGGSLDGDQRLEWRVSASINGAHTQQSFGDRRRVTVSPAVTIGAGSATQVTVLANFSHDPDNGNFGIVPLVGSAEVNPNGRISRSFADGEPKLQRFKRDQASLTWLLRHQLGGDWVVRSNGRYQRVWFGVRAVYAYGTYTDPAQTELARGAYTTRERLADVAIDTNVTGSVQTGPVRHQLLFGLDQQWSSASELIGQGTATPLDPFDPVYGTTTTLPAYQTSSESHQRQQGIYAQDQLAFHQLRLIGSGRQDWTSDRLSTGELVSGTATAQRHSAAQPTYRLGATFVSDIGLAPYFSLSSSFEPQSGVIRRTDGSSGIAEPSKGRQIEGGLKYQPRGSRILVSIAYFRIRQSNVVVTNPLDSSASTQSGQVQSKGTEMEASLPISAHLTARAAYSRQRVRDVEDINPFALGKPLIGVGRGNAALNLDYRLPEGRWSGWTLGVGVRHVDRSFGGYVLSTAGDAVDHYVTTPSYTLLDAAIRLMPPVPRRSWQGYRSR